MLYLVRRPDGQVYARDTDLGLCRFAADGLGVGSTIEQPDGEVLYRVTEESLHDDYDLFNE